MLFVKQTVVCVIMYQTLSDCVPRLFGCNVSSFNKLEYTEGRPNIMLGVVCRVICQFNDIICFWLKLS